MSFTLNIVGLKELQANVAKLPKHLEKEVTATIEAGAKLWAGNAKRDAPKDFGGLAQSISFMPTGKMSFTVVSGKEYSPYVEWGTITKVSVPSELQSYAIQFKGRGIKKNGGLIPRPFFFKQSLVVKPFIEKAIQSMANDIKL